MAQPPLARILRRLGRRLALSLLCAAPPAQAMLADASAMGWELVTLLGTALAGVAVLGRVRAPIALALLLSASLALTQGAGHAILPGWATAAIALPALALLLLPPAVARGAALLPRRTRPEILAPAAPRAARPLAPMAAPRFTPGVMVQAERTAEGALRLAVAARAGLRLRVSAS